MCCKSDKLACARDKVKINWSKVYLKWVLRIEWSPILEYIMSGEIYHDNQPNRSLR